MTLEGTYKASGELVLNSEEEELIIPKVVRSSNNGEGVDIESKGTTTTVNVNSNNVRETPSPSPVKLVKQSSSFSNVNENQHTQSNMIISGEQIKSNVNLILATCSGTLFHSIYYYLLLSLFSLFMKAMYTTDSR